MRRALVNVIEVEGEKLLPLAVSVEPRDLLLALDASAERIVSIVSANDGLTHKRCVTDGWSELGHVMMSNGARTVA